MCIRRPQAYLDGSSERLGETGRRAPVYIMQSNGGVATLARARANPINMVESGPASGVLGAIALGRIIGGPNLIALDIGGTTAKCALIEDGARRASPPTTSSSGRAPIAGYPIKVPVLDLVEIGSGGGSIAWVDAGGRLHVGPRSAGAVPGPAAYGRGGTEPTVTDANLSPAASIPDFFLGGRDRGRHGERSARLRARSPTALGVVDRGERRAA